MVDYTPPIGKERATHRWSYSWSVFNCAASSLALLLRKKGFTVTGLTVEASGSAAAASTCFETVALYFGVVSPDATPGAIDEALALSEQSVCPVWAMVKGIRRQNELQHYGPRVLSE